MCRFLSLCSDMAAFPAKVVVGYDGPAASLVRKIEDLFPKAIINLTKIQEQLDAKD